jgi:hypothetical protein
MMKLSDLAWEREDAADTFAKHPNPPDWMKDWWISRARATFANGWGVSVIQGPRIFPDWRPGLYEAVPVTPAGDLRVREMVRGDAEEIEALLASVEVRTR